MEQTFVVKTTEEKTGVWYVASVARSGRVMSLTRNKSGAARLSPAQVNAISNYAQENRLKVGLEVED